MMDKILQIKNFITHNGDELNFSREEYKRIIDYCEQQMILQDNIENLNKKELDEYAEKTFGIMLDRRRKKEDMIKELKEELLKRWNFCMKLILKHLGKELTN